MKNGCARVDAWIGQLSGADNGDGLPPADLIDHIAACARCRSMLVLLFADLAQVPPCAGSASCASVQPLIPGVVDVQLARGIAAAAQAFPDVWWHTLVCPSCDELYRELVEVAALPQVPLSLYIDGPAPSPRYIPNITLPLAMVRGYTAASRMLGTHLSDSAAEMMVAEREHEEVSIQLYIRHGAGRKMQLSIRTAPPISGVARLSLAQHTYRELLSQEGAAVFAELPEELFAEGSDAMFTVAIEQPPAGA